MKQTNATGRHHASRHTQREDNPRRRRMRRRRIIKLKQGRETRLETREEKPWV
jgi:hypothetical protein